MTPIKNVIFSLVRTILADFQAVARDVIRSCIFATDMSTNKSEVTVRDSAHLELQLLELAVDILPCNICLRSLDSSEIVPEHLSSRLELVRSLGELPLKEIDAGVPICFHCVCKQKWSEFEIPSFVREL